MILCKSTQNKKTRPIKTIQVTIEDFPRRPAYHFKTEQERTKFIKRLERLCRGSMEYRQYVKYLRENMDMNRCEVLQGLVSSKEKQYSIEIHHEPLTLFSIVDIVLAKYEDLGRCIDPFAIANDVMCLHYEGKVGLIPLSKTMHELVHAGQVFIPLTHIYQYEGLVQFVDEYEQWINPNIQDALQYKIDMTLKCGDIQSDILNPEFVYVDVDGYTLPQIPDEWGKRKLLTDPEDLANFDRLRANNSSDSNATEAPAEFRIGDTL